MQDFLPSSLTAALKLSFPVNGIHTQFRLAPKSLQRFCRPLLFYNEGSQFDLSFGGSSFLIRFSGQNFVIATKHQLTNSERNGADIGIVVEDGGKQKFLGPNELNNVSVDSKSFKSLEDILIARYEAARTDQSLDRYFLQSDTLSFWDLDSEPSPKVIAVFCIGYATDMQGYEPVIDAEGNVTGADVTSRWSPVYLESCKPTGFEDDHRLAFTLHPGYLEDIAEPDGLSGAPIFVVLQDETHQVHLGFAGMVTHSNGRNFAAYPASVIRNVLANTLTTS